LLSVSSSPAIATAAAAGHTAPSSSSARTTDSAIFQPPPVFKNINLVHNINLERSYAKETVNVVVENVSNEPQSEYYVPFTASQMERLGGFEVKDRKKGDALVFGAEPAEGDPDSNLQYYRITLPTVLAPGEQQTLGITYYFLKAYNPLPASIGQDDDQFLQYSLSAYWPSAYKTDKQKTEVKCGSSGVLDYSKLSSLPKEDDKKDTPQQPVVRGSSLTYGPFTDLPAGVSLPANVRYEYTKPISHMAMLDRDVEISHWGGNIAFEERYELHNLGANLTNLFDRARWARSQYIKPTTYALKEMRFPLHAGSVDAYYTDVVGNVSTSRFRMGKRESMLEVRPRYPVFGGWRYPFTIGWNADAGLYVRQTATGGHVLAIPFIEGPKQSEGVAYESVTLRVILPEGAENVRFHTNLPPSSIVLTALESHSTFLDTIGRPIVVIRARNLVDEHRDREVWVSYEVPLNAQLRKPLVVFVSALAGFVVWIAVARVEVRFRRKV